MKESGQVSIPIYRAKKIDSNEYVEGFYFNYDDSLGYKPMIISKESGIEFEISELTLAIHFPDMIDSEGNKIFASLSEDGKGGDIIIDIRNRKLFYYMASNGNLLLASFENINPIGTDLSKVKVIGIQE